MCKETSFDDRLPGLRPAGCGRVRQRCRLRCGAGLHCFHAIPAGVAPSGGGHSRDKGQATGIGVRLRGAGRPTRAGPALVRCPKCR